MGMLSDRLNDAVALFRLRRRVIVCVTRVSRRRRNLRKEMMNPMRRGSRKEIQ
jgi:hypothetical protein